MFSTNQKISIRQCFRLLTFDLLGLSTLLVPPLLSGYCVWEGVMAIAAGTVIMMIYLGFLGKVIDKMGTDMFSYLNIIRNKNAFLKIFRIAVLIAILILTVSTAAFAGYIFSDIIKVNLVQEKNVIIILAVILITSAYAVSAGIESRARVYEIVFYFVLIPLIIMLFMAVRDIKIEYILMEGVENSGINIIKGALVIVLMYMSLFNILFFPSFLQEKDKNKLIFTGKKALLLSSFILLMVYIILAGNIGTYAIGSIKYPIITLMSTIQMKGSFFKRTDAFMLGIWFFTLFAFLNLNIFYAVKTSRELINKKGKNIYIFGIDLIIFLIVSMFNYGGDMSGYKNLLAKIILLLLLVIPVAMFACGCHSNELSNRLFPMLAMVDKSDDKTEFAYIYPRTGLKTENGKNMANPEIAPVNKSDFNKARMAFEENVSKKTDVNHLKVMLISRSFIEDKTAFNEMLKCLREKGDFPRNTYICITDDANALLEKNEKLNTDLGSYLEEFIENHPRKKDISLATLGDLIDEQKNKKRELTMPFITMDKGTIIWKNDYKFRFSE